MFGKKNVRVIGKDKFTRQCLVVSQVKVIGSLHGSALYVVNTPDIAIE